MHYNTSHRNRLLENEDIHNLHCMIRFTPKAAVLFVDVAIQPEVRFIAKQNSLMKIGNNGNLVLGPFDESTPCLMIVLMNCQTKLRINHLTAVKSVTILEKRTAARCAGTESFRFLKVFTGKFSHVDDSSAMVSFSSNAGEDPWRKQPDQDGLIDSRLGLIQVSLLGRGER
ncbi:adhesion G protein-coupled receptor B2 [Trichonephila clavipes]|nr:adhesion G protein-coupled receptor B2 [Trichonephila clavipes]